MTETEIKLHSMEDQVSKKEKSKSFTNQVLLQFPTNDQNKYIIYVPAYLRMELYHIKEISLLNLKASIKTNLKLDFDVTHLPQEFVNIIKQKTQLMFHYEDQSIHLNQIPGVFKQRFMTLKGEKRRILGYRIEQLRTVRLYSQVFWAPFEKIFLIMSVTILPVEQFEGDKKKQLIKIIQNCLSQKDKIYRNSLKKKRADLNKVSIGFNLMDFEYSTFYEKNGIEMDAMARIFYGSETFFGNYELAQRLLKVEYTNKKLSPQLRKVAQDFKEHNNLCSSNHGYPKVSEETNKNRKTEEKYSEQSQNSLTQLIEENIKQNEEAKKRLIKPFRTAHFQISMYRIPILDLLTIFLPIWFLGLISLCVYFLSNDLGSRLKIVTTVMLSFIAYKPLVRKLLPPNPKITFIEIIIYTLLFISFLLLLSSFINDQLESEFVWNKDGFFIISLIIQIATTLSIIILIVGYYLYWKPSYNIQPGVKILLKLDQWKNQKCDKYFYEKMEINQITIKPFPVKENPQMMINDVI